MTGRSGRESNVHNKYNKHNKVKESERIPILPKNIGTFASLRISNFRYFLTGSLFSNTAHWIQQITLNWLIYHLTGSGTMLGSINVVRSIASLSMIPVAGLLIDRLNRRMLIIVTNCWLFLITIVLSFLLFSDYAKIWHLFIFAFLGGAAQTVDLALRQVVVFDIVPRKFIPNAVAIVQTGWSLMRSFGPGIGGFLILWFGPAGNFLIQASAYGIIALNIMRIRFPEQKEVEKQSPIENVLEGIRYVTRDQITRTFMLMGFVLPLFTIPVFVILLPVYAVDVFHSESGKVLGLLTASIGMGGIFGGIVTASLGRFERRGLVQLASLLMLNLALIWFAFGKQLYLALLLLGIAGFFEMIFLTTNQTLLQLSIPDNLRGRVTSVVNLNAVLSPVGSMIAGVGCDLLNGPERITIILAGVSAGIAVWIFFKSKVVRDYRISKAINQA